jgi:mono/diheme cytochrome c family protein
MSWLIIIVAFLIFSPFQALAADQPDIAEGERIYQHYCFVCHGTKGNGKGFNAEYLDPKPADHTNAENMSQRTDEKLFDTISEGGKAVGKSTFMPPWGGTFKETQIESLILYLRQLCNCQGP